MLRIIRSSNFFGKNEFDWTNQVMFDQDKGF